MTNKTIPALNAAGPLDGTEPIETVQAGASVRTTTQDIANLGGGGGGGGFPLTATPITTGASTVQADHTKDLYAITSGGTGGTEVINLNNISGGVGGNAPEWSGHIITFVLATQTDPSDSVQLTFNNSASIFGQSLGPAFERFIEFNPVILDYESASFSVIWQNDGSWAWVLLDNGNNDSTSGGINVVLKGYPSQNLDLEPDATGLLRYLNSRTAYPGDANAVWVQNGALVKGANGGFTAGLHDVTGSRALDTVYTNTTGRPMFVSIPFTIAGTACGVAFEVNGNGVFVYQYQANSPTNNASVCGFVPPGATYEALVFGTGTVNISNWYESY